MKKLLIINGCLSLLIILTMCQSSTESCKKKCIKNNFCNNNILKIADSLIDDQLIINRDTTDNWETEKLQSLKHETLINQIFEWVYTGRAKVYDYFTGKEMSIEDVKKQEQSGQYNRKNIGKLQLTEYWLINKEQSSFYRKIKSITPGYELFNDAGELKGHKAWIKIVLPDTLYCPNF